VRVADRELTLEQSAESLGIFFRVTRHERVSRRYNGKALNIDAVKVGIIIPRRVVPRRLRLSSLANAGGGGFFYTLLQYGRRGIKRRDGFRRRFYEDFIFNPGLSGF
jgi:hypothetical protein